MRTYPLFVVGVLCAVPAAAQAPAIREWPVPWPQTFTRDPYVATDGRVFFCGMNGNYVGVLDTLSGEFQRFELPNPANPHSLLVDPAGIVWYTGNRGGHIGRLDPATGQVTTFPMPDSAARDPHSLVRDAAGDIWFTAQGSNFVGKLTVATGAIRLVRVPTPRARPYGIAVDRTGRPWVALFGTNRIATVDPASFTLREVTLPNADSRARRLVVTSDGRVWYGDYARGYVGVYDPRTETFKEWALPAGAGARPYAVEVDGQDRIWAVQTGVQPNTFVGFDTKTERFLPATAIPSGAGTVRHMVYNARGRAIWFATDASTVGRAVVP
jgi:virginiamycin B lyase